MTCLAHRLHYLAEFIRIEHEIVDKFLFSMKKFLSKSGRGKRDLKNITGLHLPPKVVNTLWGTWMQSVFLL